MYFTAIPGLPSDVTLLEAAKDYMVLGWKEPAKTGGADIRGYFVDYRTVKGGVAGKWHEMNHKAVTTTTYKVRYFTPGTKFFDMICFFSEKIFNYYRSSLST